LIFKKVNQLAKKSVLSFGIGCFIGLNFYIHQNRPPIIIITNLFMLFIFYFFVCLADDESNTTPKNKM